MRTAIFSGSFDPVHIGHAMLANHVAQSGEVDELWLMPSRLNPLKRDSPPAAETHRLAMCRIVAENCTGVRASDFELHMPSPSYTYETLCRLRDEFPDREFVLLVGSDNWLCFDRWRNHEKIIREFGILIYPRPGSDIDAMNLPENVMLLRDVPQALISSTFIRSGLAAGKDMNFLVPDGVLDYIKTTGLYG